MRGNPASEARAMLTAGQTMAMLHWPLTQSRPEHQAPAAAWMQLKLPGSIRVPPHNRGQI
jgi:hypothetical protein